MPFVEYAEPVRTSAVPTVQQPPTMETKYRTLLQAAIIVVLLGVIVHFSEPVPAGNASVTAALTAH